ncbi:SOS response-associated peptidase family protein [Stakelama sp. CBK3Z-3]|uniref:Abasic site processing protein n=1 Tax=Stakelama flava TaxID=2860338 RepID=A0ABS6XPQ8_9SPHN|nr:SOS response-associated peptidase family protein [Stakelama flava]MBW4331381.1 SOS response-associated peptidase family protein [Stakelama flava]
MCNRARNRGEPETLFEHFGGDWLTERPRDNRFNPVELYPKSRAYVFRNDRETGFGLDVMQWDVLGGGAKWPMTNVRRLDLPQWRRLAEKPDNRCLIPLTEFCEWTPEKDPEQGIKGEMWFAVRDQPVFAVAGFWQQTGKGASFAMVTCDANELVRPIHPKAMITILHRGDYDRWLQGSYDEIVALQQPFPADRMTVRGPVFPTRQR